jgi:hypothetical protein
MLRKLAHVFMNAATVTESLHGIYGEERRGIGPAGI